MGGCFACTGCGLGGIFRGMRWTVVLTGTLGWILVVLAGAVEPVPGHSWHGEAFNEGPRQQAVLMEGCGKVSFPVSVKQAEAQAFFNQGVGQLHGFWYYEAERSFRQVAMLEPDCAMAYWGCAMANVNHENRAAGFMKEAIKRRANADQREQGWLDALNRFYADPKKDKKQRHLDFISDMEGVVHANPDDVEAKAFLAWAIWKARDAGVPMVSREAVESLLMRVFEHEPMHPAHHYRIHLWDDGKVERALPSVAHCGPAAPGIAHMWHMPAHTFSKLNRWEESAWQQEAALRVDHAYVLRTRVLTDQIHNYAHNAEWLIRTWNQLGRARASVALAKNLIEMPRHPDDNTLEKGNTQASHGRTRLLETLLKFELWEELTELGESPWLDRTVNPSHEAARLRALGIAAFFQKDASRLNKMTALLQTLKKTEAVKKPDQKTSAEATKETKKKKPSEVTEALAELLVLKGMIATPQEAPVWQKLEALEGVPAERLTRYWWQAGKMDKAVEAAGKLPSDAPGLALKAEVLMTAGQMEETRQAFDTLRSVGVSMDADLPVMKRLGELAKALELPEQWQMPTLAPMKEDHGLHPELETFGPLRWQPAAMESLALPDADGRMVDVRRDFAGKPVLLVFYLSGECGHCLEQLKAFQKMAGEYEKAGIKLLAIGAETGQELPGTAKKIRVSGKEETDIPLLADPGLEAFKRWRCHDDFENMPLHGTFLVDENGKVRWQDVGFAPFDNARFLLIEAKRLLSLNGESG